MHITVNGKVRVIEAGFSLEQLLLDCGLDTEKTVVALNNHIVRREDYSRIILNDNDVCDVMSFVGGG